METRHLQKTGGSSFILTLPKTWIQTHNLSAKNEVAVYIQKTGQLCIWPAKKNIYRKAFLPIDYLSEMQIVRELIGHYTSGVDEIIVQARTITYEQRALVRSVSYKLIGFELFEGTSSTIVLKNISTSAILAPEFVQKILGIIQAMYSDLIIVLSSNNKNLAKDIIERDVEVDRIHLAIMRQLNNVLYTMIPPEGTDLSSLDLHYYSHVAIRLERIADHIVRIAETLLQLDHKDLLNLTRPEMISVNKITEYLTQCSKIISSLDKRGAHQLLDLYESKTKNEFINKKITNKSSINILIEDSIERIRGYVANIAEETIDYCILKSNYFP